MSRLLLGLSSSRLHHCLSWCKKSSLYSFFPHSAAYYPHSSPLSLVVSPYSHKKSDDEDDEMSKILDNILASEPEIPESEKQEIEKAEKKFKKDMKRLYSEISEEEEEDGKHYASLEEDYCGDEDEDEDGEKEEDEDDEDDDEDDDGDDDDDFDIDKLKEVKEVEVPLAYNVAALKKYIISKATHNKLVLFRRLVDENCLAEAEHMFRRFSLHDYRHLDAATLKAFAKLVAPGPNPDYTEDPDEESDDVIHEQEETDEEFEAYKDLYAPLNRLSTTPNRLTIVHLLHAMYVSGMSTDETMDILEDSGYPKNISSYFQLFFPYYTDSAVSDCAIWIFEVTQRLEIVPNRAVLSLVMAAHIRANQPSAAIDLFEQFMSDVLDVKENLPEYASVWKAWRTCKATREAQTTQERNAGRSGYFGVVNSTYLMYAQLFKALIMDRRLDEAKLYYVQMVGDTGARPPTSVLIQVMKLFITLDEVEAALRLFDSMKAEHYQLPVEVYNLIISACNQPKYFTYALEVLHRMKTNPDPLLNPTEETYVYLINICRACGEHEEEARMIQEKFNLQKKLREAPQTTQKNRRASVYSFDGLGSVSTSLLREG